MVSICLSGMSHIGCSSVCQMPMCLLGTLFKKAFALYLSVRNVIQVSFLAVRKVTSDLGCFCPSACLDCSLRFGVLMMSICLSGAPSKFAFRLSICLSGTSIWLAFCCLSVCKECSFRFGLPQSIYLSETQFQCTFQLSICLSGTSFKLAFWLSICLSRRSLYIWFVSVHLSISNGSMLCFLFTD